MANVEPRPRISPYGGSLPIIVILTFTALWFFAYLTMRG